MPIAFVSVTNGTDLAPAEPAGAAENHILLAILNNEDNATAVVTPATGWAQVPGLFDEGMGTGTQLMSGVYWIRRGASAVANNWAISAGGAARIASVAAFSGCKLTGDPWNGTPVLTLGTDNAAVYGTVTTTLADCFLVALQSVFTWGAVTATGGWDERLDQASSGPAAIHTRAHATAGDSPSLVVTGATSWVAHLLALAPEPVVPLAPTITTQAGGHLRAGVQWTPGSDGGSAITSWDIDHATAAAPTTWLGPTNTASTNPYGAVTGLTNGTAYVFRVRGVNAVGNGAWSSTSGSATPTDVRGYFKLESGDFFLLESGDKWLLESGPGDGGTPGMRYWGFRMR